MAVKIRLARWGSKNRPFYRIVVANARTQRDGKFLEIVGTYHPLLSSDHQKRLMLKSDRIEYWLNHGAIPTDRIFKFITNTDIKLPSKLNKKFETKVKARTIKLSKKELKKAREEQS
ncbi:MAG: 30S ribosomal protein S16 [Rickettsiaceae bacterium]